MPSNDLPLRRRGRVQALHDPAMAEENIGLLGGEGAATGGLRLGWVSAKNLPAYIFCLLVCERLFLDTLDNLNDFCTICVCTGFHIYICLSLHGRVVLNHF